MLEANFLHFRCLSCHKLALKRR